MDNEKAKKTDYSHGCSCCADNYPFLTGHGVACDKHDSDGRDLSQLIGNMIASGQSSAFILETAREYRRELKQ